MKAKLSRKSMTFAALLILLIWTLAVSVQAQTEKPKPGPELKQLEKFVGDWTYSGEQFEVPIEGLPFEGAGTFIGKFTTRFILDGFFQETSWQDEEGPSGTMSGMGIMGYDAKTKTYVEHSYISDGSRSTKTVTLNGTTWTSSSTFTTKTGEELRVKGVAKYSPDWLSYSSTTEISDDNGKTWHLWFNEKGVKVK